MGVIRSISERFGVATVALVASTLAACSGGPSPTLSVPPQPVSALEVIDKQPHAPDSDDFAWAAWTQTQAGLEDLWSTFQLEGAPLRLADGEAILLAATGESGSCPMTVEQVDVRAGIVELSTVEYPEAPDRSSFESSAGALEPVCTSDFNPITFVIVVEAAETVPPLEVDLSETSLVLDEPDRLTQVPFGLSRESD